MGQFHPLCRLDEVPDRSARSLIVDEQMICVVRIENEVFALDDRCPHAGASLARGYLEDEVLRCRIHHWGFRVRDGVYVDADNPCFNAKSMHARVVEGMVEVWIED